MSDSNRNYGEESRPHWRHTGQDRPLNLPPPPPVPEETLRKQALGGAKNIASRAQNYYDNTVAPAFERSRAKGFYDNKVVPTTRNATYSVKQTVTDQHARWVATPVSRAAVALLIVALLATISTFLPMGPTSFRRYSSAAGSVIDGNFEGIAELVLVQVVGVITAFMAATIFRLFLLVTIVASIVAIALRGARAKKVAGISGAITGLLGALIGIAALFVTGSLDNVPVGIGTILLLIFSAIVAVTAFVLLRSSKRLVLPPPVPARPQQA